jgi:hypothetical protein
MQSVANGGQYWASCLGISAKAAIYLREVPVYGKDKADLAGNRETSVPADIQRT